MEQLDRVEVQAGGKSDPTTQQSVQALNYSVRSSSERLEQLDLVEVQAVGSQSDPSQSVTTLKKSSSVPLAFGMTSQMPDEALTNPGDLAGENKGEHNNTATNTTTTTPPTTTMQMPLKCMVIVGSVMATILLQLVHPSTFQTHHNSKENQMKTAKTWTAHDLGAIALEKKMALVVSKIVGSSSNESEFSTNLASSRRRWGLLLMYDT